MLAQTTLFDRGSPRVDTGFSGLRHFALEGAAWVEYAPSWLSGHVSLFEVLASTTRWHEDKRVMYEKTVEIPRLTARFPEDGRGHEALGVVRCLLSARYDRDLGSIRANLYRDGRDSVAMHGDRVAGAEDAVVAILSLGEPRRFLMKPASGGRSVVFHLGWGDLLVMGGACQRTWHHGVPKAESAFPRMSIMFREARAVSE